MPTLFLLLIDCLANSAIGLFTCHVIVLGFRFLQGQGAAHLFGHTSGLCPLRRLPDTGQGLLVENQNFGRALGSPLQGRILRLSTQVRF